MDRVYQSNAVGTPPAATPSSGAYPTAGNKSVGQLATVPGPYWFYSITEEIRNAIVAAGLTPDPAQVNQLALAMTKFLPLSGGTLTGAIKFSGNGSVKGSTDSSSIQVYGGTAWNLGSMIGVYGKDHASRAGWLYLSAHDGTNTKTLIGKPDGTLTWDGKNVVRSVNGATADASGNVTLSVNPSALGTAVVRTTTSGGNGYVTFPSGGTWAAVIVYSGSYTDGETTGNSIGATVTVAGIAGGTKHQLYKLGSQEYWERWSVQALCFKTA